jgi:hypothetical protein
MKTHGMFQNRILSLATGTLRTQPAPVRFAIVIRDLLLVEKQTPHDRSQSRPPTRLAR